MVETRVPRWVPVALVLSMFLAGMVPTPGAAASVTMEIMDGALPTPRDGTSAVRAGSYIYIFGGDDGSRKNDILRYHPASDTMAKMNAVLPSPRSGTSAVYDGTHIFVFGGWSGATYSNQVVRYDPATDSVAIMTATLPSGRYYTSAVWAGSAAYIFGGGVTCSPCTTDQILKYVPATDTLTITNATLPMRRYGTSAVWDGAYAYIFGGVTSSSSTEYDEIVRYDPVTGAVTVLPQKLPTARYHTSAMWHDNRAYVFGGYPCNGYPHFCRDIVEFFPPTGAVTLLDTSLVSGRYLTSSAANDTHAFIFGGYTGTRTNQTLRFGPPDSPPLPNGAPLIGAVADIVIGAGRTVTKTVTATDPENDTLTLAILDLPVNGTFTDHGNGTGTFAWPTGLGDVGNHTFTIRASDGQLTSTRTFRVTVSGNPPVEFEPLGTIEHIEGDPIYFLIHASDPEGENITLTMPSIPAGAVFRDEGAGVATFAWNTTFTDAGVYPLEVRGSDGTTTATMAFTIVVTNVDRKPVFAPVSEVLAVQGTPLSTYVHATDPDADPITLTTSTLPSGAHWTDFQNGTGRLTWTPSTTTLGLFNIVVTATANGNSTEIVQAVKVVPPVAFTMSPLDPSSLAASPGQLLSLRLRVENTGGTPDTYTFRAFDTSRPGSSWVLQVPPPLTLAPGSSADVLFKVTVPLDGTYAKPRIIGTSDANDQISRMLTWIVDVPVFLTVRLDDTTPAVADLSALQWISGEVEARWLNGDPVVDVDVSVTQTPDSLAQLASTQSGRTDSDGLMRFAFTNDPTALVPGGHDVVAKSHRPGRVDSAGARYTIGLA